MLSRVGRRVRREVEKRQRLSRLPDHVVLLLTNPRSGSTWLFDALRCHPALILKPEADLFVYFGMSGRRYPGDLRGDPQNAVEIEVRPGQWEALPPSVLPSALTSPVRNLPPYHLEKCHPHFFKHDVEAFTGRLRDLNARGDVKMIYQMRDPRASILSFLKYKERNPSWNPHLTPEKAIPHMRRIFETLDRCAAAYPGLIVDYDELAGDVQGTLARIFSFVWPGQQASDPALLAEIAEATRRSRRGATPFLGERVNQPADDLGEHAPLFAQFAADIDAVYAAYESLKQRVAGGVQP